MAIEKNLGIVSPVPKGEWSNSDTYHELNIVYHNSNSYIAKKGNINIEPSKTPNWEEYWMLLTKSSHTVYLGTADSVDKLNSYTTTAQAGDYVRASAAFTYNGEQVHSSDLLIYTGSAWDVIHSEDTANFAKLDEENTFTYDQTISNTTGTTTYKVHGIDANPNAGIFNIKGGAYGGVSITSENATSKANSYCLFLREDTLQAQMTMKSYNGGYSTLQFTEPKNGSATVEMPDHSGTLALVEDLDSYIPDVNAAIKNATISERQLVLDTNNSTASMFIEPLINRMIGFPTDKITVECCRADEQDSEGNDVWLDYFEDAGIGEAEKTNKLGAIPLNKSYFIIGGLSRQGATLGEDGTYTFKGKVGDKLRFTFDFEDSGYYFSSNALYTSVSREYYNAKLKIETSMSASDMGGDYNVADNTFITINNNLPVTGWTGTNSYKLEQIFGSHNVQRKRKLRITYTIFSVDSSNSNITENSGGFVVYGCTVFSKTYWNARGIVAKTGKPYSIYSAGEHNAIFENDVYVESTTDYNKLLRRGKVFNDDVTVDGAWTFSKAPYSFNGYQLANHSLIDTRSGYNAYVFKKNGVEDCIGFYNNSSSDKGLFYKKDSDIRYYTLPQSADTLVGKNDLGDYLSLSSTASNIIYSDNYFHRSPSFYEGIRFHKIDFSGVANSKIDVDGIELHNDETVPGIKLTNSIDRGSYIEITKDYIKTTVDNADEGEQIAATDDSGEIITRKYNFPTSSGTLVTDGDIEAKVYSAGTYYLGSEPGSTIERDELKVPTNVYKITLKPAAWKDDSPFAVFGTQGFEVEIVLKPTRYEAGRQILYAKCYSPVGTVEYVNADNVIDQMPFFNFAFTSTVDFFVEVKTFDESIFETE